MIQTTEYNPDRTHRLVVLRFSALGDVALSVPVLLAFLEKYPNYVVTVVTRPKFSPIFENIPSVQVLEAQLEGDHKEVWGLFQLYRSIKELQPEAIIDLHNVLRTRILHLFSFFDSTQIKRIDKGRSEKRALTRSANKAWKPLKHTTVRYKEVFEGLGFDFDMGKPHTLPSMPMPMNVKGNRAHQGKLIGIAPFAAHQGKMYSLDKLENVVAWLNTEMECTILCFGGGNNEKTAIEPWEDKYQNCVNLIGKTSFSEELSVISNLDLMISMDSGNGHLAAIYGVPTLILWGITHPYAGFAPFNQGQENFLLADSTQFPKIPTSIYGNTCPKGYEEAINSISEDMIISRIKEILGQST